MQTCSRPSPRVEPLTSLMPDAVALRLNRRSDEAHREAAEEAKKAWVPRASGRTATAGAPVSMAMNREIQTGELTGCWLNILPVPPIVPWSLYRVKRRGDALIFSGVAGCCCVLPCPLACGRYRRNEFGDVLTYDKWEGSMAATSFSVRSSRHMTSTNGGTVYKLC